MLFQGPPDFLFYVQLPERSGRGKEKMRAYITVAGTELVRFGMPSVFTIDWRCGLV